MITAPTMMKWKCATTKQVSCQCTASAAVASATPVMPPKTRKKRKPQMYANGVLKEMAPRYMVPTQLKTLMAVKMPTTSESTPKTPLSNTDCPATNRWCPQVKNPTKAMPSEEYAIAL